jgi:hypothetical protein
MSLDTRIKFVTLAVKKSRESSSLQSRCKIEIIVLHSSMLTLKDCTDTEVFHLSSQTRIITIHAEALLHSWGHCSAEIISLLYRFTHIKLMHLLMYVNWNKTHVK